GAAMLRLAPPPPPVCVEPRHRYADLLGAVSLALSVCGGGPATAQALAGIDFDLPEGAPTAEDRVQLDAAGPLYFASELERAALLPTAELIAGLFASGAIVQPLGPVANLLHDFWRGRRERMTAEEREAVFARVIETPYFERLMRGLCEAIAAHADPVLPGGPGLHAQVALATQAQRLGAFLAQRVDPMAAIAARDIVGTINTALAFLRDRQLQRAFGVRDLWRLVEIVGSQHGVAAGDALQHVERGRSGQTVLLWLSKHYAEQAIALDPAAPADVELLVAAQRWLASAPAAGAPTSPARFPLPQVA
ncbi:MAG: hypothetical protein ACTHOH_15650, partial [Lysobacteraceae bacterium]